MTQASTNTSIYYPGSGADWERKAPKELGMDSDALQKAIEYSEDPAREGYPRDLTRYVPEKNAAMPNDDGATLGPVKDHGPVTGLVVRHGYIVKEWGDPERVDMTFSVTKSFLSTVAGLAWDRGLIKDVHDRVKDYVDDGGFDSPHNATITWDHFLRQINEWEGTLWDKPHTAGNTDGEILDVVEPGTRYEYNDVRVNRLALSLLNVWKRPLPEVLKEYVMDPIGASDTWKWNGYDNSYANIDGKRMQSVSGGGHWGGGMWISARDLARFGYLTLRRGKWDGKQILSEKWIEMATTPGKLNPNYGFMNYFLNTNRELFPSGPESGYFHAGAGANRVWVDPEHDIVVVIRWLDAEHFDGFVKHVMDAVKS